MLVVISPEGDDDRELTVLHRLFAAGLVRYHLRKPGWSHTRLATWLDRIPAEQRQRIVLHQHHDLVIEKNLGGWHANDAGRATSLAADGLWRSRACHTLTELRAALTRYDSVLVSPVFRSVSKRGHGPDECLSSDELRTLLATRSTAERRTAVIALGGITVETAPRALALGFDGVAALGAIWQAADPVAAFLALQHSLACHAA